VNGAEATDVDVGEAGRGRPLLRVAGLTVVLGFALMWAYIFATQGSHQPAGWLEDRRFPEAAQPICAAARAEIDALPKAIEARSATERADVIDVANAALRRMQERLRQVIPQGGRERYIRQWVDDWTIYIDDRADYAARLRQDERAEFLVTKKYGAQLSKSIDNFAIVNKMPDCATPDDV
jgi:hypothetical protein